MDCAARSDADEVPIHDFSLSCVSSVSFRGRFAARMHLNLKRAKQNYIYPFRSFAGNHIYIYQHLTPHIATTVNKQKHEHTNRRTCLQRSERQQSHPTAVTPPRQATYSGVTANKSNLQRAHRHDASIRCRLYRCPSFDLPSLPQIEVCRSSLHIIPYTSPWYTKTREYIYDILYKQHSYTSE